MASLFGKMSNSISLVWVIVCHVIRAINDCNFKNNDLNVVTSITVSFPRTFHIKI